ncbi:MAG: beta-lactamase hydrolase domain-containing protein [Sphingomonadales bacterium]
MIAILRITISILYIILIGLTPSLADESLEVPNLRHPLPNVSTGGQPSLEDIGKLKSMGYSVVVNLRGEGEFDDFDEEKAVEGAGLKYINIPFQGMRGLTPENAKTLHDLIEGADGKVLLHCTIGMRAGSLLGVEKYLFGNLTKKEALELATQAHMSNLEDYLLGALENITN